MADGRDMTERTANSYIHGTEPTEQRRLAELNRMTNPRFVEFLRVVPDMWVLEVGSGLGILARDVAAAATRVHVVALERSPEQLAAARRVPVVQYLRGDGNHLPIQDQRFDLVRVGARWGPGTRLGRNETRRPNRSASGRVRERRDPAALRSAMSDVRSRLGGVSGVPGSARGRQSNRPSTVSAVPARWFLENRVVDSARCSLARFARVRLVGAEHHRQRRERATRVGHVRVCDRDADR